MSDPLWPASVCVFCGSRSGDNPDFAVQARRMGTLLGEKGIQLIYGGGGIGLMAETANAAIAAGGKVTGIIPEFLRAYEVGTVEGATELLVESMHARKALMFEKSDAFVVLPGGIGTLEEAIEITTWKQLQQHKKPVVFVNIDGYWDPFMALIDQVVEQGFGHHQVRSLFSMVGHVDDVFAAIESQPHTTEEVLTSHL